MNEFQFHEAAEIFPLMSKQEFEGLKADIAAHGLREAIWLHPDGRILDGRNRYRACMELGVAPTFRTWDGQGNVWEFVLSLNLHRRHLDSLQRACVAQNVLPHLEAKAHERQLATLKQNGTVSKKVYERKDSNEGKATAQAAKLLRTNSRYVTTAKQLKEELPELYEKACKGKVTHKVAQRELAIHRRQVEVEQARHRTITLPPLITLKHGDFRELCKELADGSIDFILTDPPYIEECIHLWGDLAREAKRLLKPGGYLFAYCGTYFMFDCMTRLAKHLDYRHTACQLHRDGYTKMWTHDLLTAWKPILIYSNGTPKQKFRGMVDVVSGGKGDKTAHDWAQPQGEAEYFLEYMTLPGQVVLDPFMGSGTVPRAAHRMGRVAIGFELNEGHYLLAKSSIAGSQHSDNSQPAVV